MKNVNFGIANYPRYNEAYEDCLKQYGSGFHFPKKDARILFNTQTDLKSSLTTDILVERFKSPSDNEYLYEQYSFDIGNCLSNWDEWTLCDVLIKLNIFWGLHPNCRIKSLLQLAKITEWRGDIAPWVYRWFN